MSEAKLFKLLSEGDYAAVLSELKGAEVSVITAFLSGIGDTELSGIINLMPHDDVADVLVEADTPLQNRILLFLKDNELKEVMDEVSVEDTLEIMDDMPENIVRRIVENDEILSLIQSKRYATVRPLLEEQNPADIANLLEVLPKTEIAPVFRILPKSLAADTFAYMESGLQKYLIDIFTDAELKDIIKELYLDDTVDIIEEMPANVVKRIIAQSDGETRKSINELLNYPKDSAGSIMTIEFVSLKASMTVSQAFERIRKTGIDKETIYTLYVTDETNKLTGVVSAKSLMLEKPDTVISSIMQEKVICVDTHTDREEVANMFSRYGFLAVPVVDNEHRLVGIVTVDDALEVLQQEHSEDIAKMHAVTPSEKPYLKTSVWKLWLYRVPWLLILMISATFTGFIISANEATLNMPVYGIILTACIPMLMDTGGNAGSQASVTIIRGMALGEIKLKDFFVVIWKEFRVSLMLGATLAVACFAKLMAIDRLWSVDNGLIVSAGVCISLFLTVVIAKLIGGILPILAKKVRLDPAVVASPFITTIVDALSLSVYCVIAVTMLGAL